MTPSLEQLLKSNPQEAAKQLQREIAWWSKNKIRTYYPETGPLRLELYVKHKQYFDAGKEYRARACVAANRVGKTEGIGAYEVTLHTTGEYPTWWKGHRFTQANNWWVAGDTNQTTRDILQAKLLGKIVREKGDDASKPAGLGTGMIPASAIKATRAKAGSIPNAVETVWIKHKSGGVSTITFKSYEQGREAFQGTEQDGIWLDEECDEGIYNECLIRTMATGSFKGGIMMLTFTPLSGWSDVVAKFLDPEECRKSHSFVIQMGWDDAPHLSEQSKAEMLAHLPPHQRDARTKGVPQLGSGAIYPIGESEVSVNPFDIPAYWPRVFGLDVGWNRTAAIWLAVDREADTVYAYQQHYQAHSEPGDNTRAIKARGAWIPGVIDPASRGRSQVDGSQLIEQYQNLGLELSPAVNAVDAGIYEVWERLVSGRLKIFASLADFWKEFRVYRRDEKGRVVKKNDHLMDALRYGIKSGLEVAKQKPVRTVSEPTYMSGRDVGMGWLG